jgi:predicted RNase H-like nuclease (RuvC/YqgF family)
MQQAFNPVAMAPRTVGYSVDDVPASSPSSASTSTNSKPKRLTSLLTGSKVSKKDAEKMQTEIHELLEREDRHIKEKGTLMQKVESYRQTAEHASEIQSRNLQLQNTVAELRKAGDGCKPFSGARLLR